MKDLQNSGFVDNRWISQKQDDLNVKYNEAMIAIDEWAYYWVLNEVNQTGTSLAEYNIYKTKMDNLIGDIAGIQRILKKASVKNEDRINELNQTIGVFTDENTQLTNRLDTFKINENTNIKQLSIDDKLFVETIFMNLLYLFSITSMIIVVIRKIYQK
tara:strand:+ start:413 stop:886 length:474 start_codon:yes stop_codon:yes gene_type:complete